MTDVSFEITATILLFFFLIPIPPGIILLNFLTRKIWGIDNVFRELDLLLYNLLHKDDERRKITEDIPHVFPLFVWISGFAFTMLFLAVHEAEFSLSTIIIFIMLGLSFLFAASFQIAGFFFLKLLGKLEIKIDKELELTAKKYGFSDQTKFGLKRRHKNHSFYLTGIFTRYRSSKYVTIQMPHNMIRLFYITLEDKEKLAKEIGQNNAEYIINHKYPIHLKKGWFSLDLVYEKLNTIDEVMDKMIEILRKFEQRGALER